LFRSEFLASLNDAPYLPHNDSPAPIASSSSNQIGGLPINNLETASVAPSTENVSGTGKEKEKEKITSTGPSVPGSPINK